MSTLNLIDLNTVVFDTNNNQTCYNFTFHQDLQASQITFGFPVEFRLTHPIIDENVPGSMEWVDLRGLKFNYIGSLNSQNYVIYFQGNTSNKVQDTLSVEINGQNYILSVPKCQIVNISPISYSLVSIHVLRIVWDEVRDMTRCYFDIRLLEDLDIFSITLGFPLSLMNGNQYEWITQSSKFKGLKINELPDFSCGTQIKCITFNGNATMYFNDYITFQAISEQDIQVGSCKIPEYDHIKSSDIPIIVILKKIIYNKLNDTTTYYFSIEVLGNDPLGIGSIIFGFPLELQNSYLDDNFEGVHEWIISEFSFKGLNYTESFTQQQGKLERHVTFRGDISNAIKPFSIKVRSGMNTDIYQLTVPEPQVCNDILLGKIIIQKIVYDHGLNQTYFHFQITSDGQTDINNIIFGFPQSLSALAVNHNFDSYGAWVRRGYLVSEKFTQGNTRERFICFQGNVYPQLTDSISVKIKGGHSCNKEMVALTNYEEVSSTQKIKANIFINRVLIDKQRNRTYYYFIIHSLGESEITSLVLQYPILQFPIENDFTGEIRKVQNGFQINESFDQIAKQRYLCFQGDVTSLVGSKFLAQAFNGSIYQTLTIDIPLLDLIAKKCECHTYSMGYWKNHLLEWPVGTADRLLCNKKWLDIMETPPEKNNKWIIMAKQWITTQLNVIYCDHPECIPEKVNIALEDLNDLLLAHCNSDLETVNVKQKAYQLKDVLESYNQGKIGPGKDEEVNSKNACEVIVNLSNNGSQDILEKIQELIERPYDKIIELNNKIDIMISRENPKSSPDYDEFLTELFQCTVYRAINRKVSISIEPGTPKVIKLSSSITDFRIFPQMSYHIYKDMIILDEPATEDLSIHLNSDDLVQVCYL
jgi:hypothetical protein